MITIPYITKAWRYKIAKMKFVRKRIYSFSLTTYGGLSGFSFSCNRDNRTAHGMNSPEHKQLWEKLDYIFSFDSRFWYCHYWSIRHNQDIGYMNFHFEYKSHIL